MRADWCAWVYECTRDGSGGVHDCVRVSTLRTYEYTYFWKHFLFIIEQ